jgi:CHAT domain-containing protein
LTGSGRGGSWTWEDDDLPNRLRQALARVPLDNQVQGLIQKLRTQRLAPLAPHLSGVKRLVVVPVGRMARLPVEVLTDQYTVNYTPSGTNLARLHDRPPPRGTALLAVGDPVFPTAELPGSRYEIACLAELFPASSVTRLLRADASEQRLDELRRSGALPGFRYLHLATHGEANNMRSFDSALILSRPAEVPLPRAGEPYLDGRLTANEVLDYWKLDADLVTLSACESGLGREGGGDGLLGFAQAFLLAGSRAVCLSLWKVDDTATALLMTRFYENLLGKRADLKGPLGRAVALQEAKRWLRDLRKDQVTVLAARLKSGGLRGTVETLRPVVEPVKSDPKAERPYAHPYYWAAFVLIGNPD